MFKVTNELGGTAFEHGHIENLIVLGKTGTAEVKKHHKQEEERDLDRWNPNAAHAWFAGWAPAEDPEIAIVVFVEHGGAGGQVAWPIGKQILESYYVFRIHKGVELTLDYQLVNNPAYNADRGPISVLGFRLHGEF